MSSVCRYLGDHDPYAGDTAAIGTLGEGLALSSARSLGGVWLLDGLRRQLGVDTALRAVLGRGGSPPTSSGCCSRWSPTGPWTRSRSWPRAVGATCDVAVPGLPGMDEDQAYRAMDLRPRRTTRRMGRRAAVTSRSTS